MEVDPCVCPERDAGEVGDSCVDGYGDPAAAAQIAKNAGGCGVGRDNDIGLVVPDKPQQ
jgi:hypothetical protein